MDIFTFSYINLIKNIMKKLSTTINIALVTIFLFTSCGGKVKGLNIVGDWHHEISKNMGGYIISSKTKLTIVRNGPGDYDYRVETTVIDAMYGGQPKTDYSNGKLEKEVKEKKWHFIGGNYGNRGAYIAVPSDNWNDYKPSSISVNFDNGRGNSMMFNAY